jgi:mycothiol synthase
MATAEQFSDISLREVREEDAEEVARLFRVVFGEDRPVDAEQVVSWVRNRELKPDWLRVVELDGRIVGYGDIAIDEQEVAVDVAAPDHSGRLFEWAEERARAERVRRVRTHVPAGHELERLAERRGYRLWRCSYTMEVVLDDVVPEAPVMPTPFVLRRYEPDDADALRAALDEAFAEDPFFHETTPGYFREFYLRARGFDPSLWLLAWDEDELAGFLLAFPERAGDRSLGWIDSLGVRPRWRRQGLGHGLLRTALHELHARGLRRVGLGVDAENATGALRLYEGVGMVVVRHWNNWTLDLTAD